MKNIGKISCILLVFALMACDTDKLLSLKDDFKIAVTPDAVGDKKELHIVNALNSETTVNDVKLTIEGEYASEIFTSDGLSALKLDEGRIVIGLRHGITATEEDPIVVLAKISAEGYLDKTVEIVFDGTEVESLSIPVLEVANLPSTIKVKKESAVLAANKTAETIAVTIASADEEEALASIAIEEGSSFVDQDGAVVSGSDIALNVQSFELGTGAGNEDTGFSAINEIEEISIPGDNVLEPFSVIDINPTVNGKTVNLSEANLASMSVSVPDDGEEYEVYLKTPGNDTPEQITITEAGTGAKTASAARFGFRRYSFSWRWWGRYYIVKRIRSPYCASYPRFNVVNNGPATQYYLSIKNAQGNTVSSKLTTLFSGQTKTLAFDSRLVKNRNYTLNVTANTIDGKKELTAQRISCGQQSTVDVSVPNAKTENFDIEFSITCSKATVTLNNTVIYFKKATGKNFLPFGVVKNGVLGKTPKLEDNTEYVFSFVYQQKRQTNPIKGSKVRDIIDSYDVNEICAKIEDEM
ncbi:hypothetical protein SAMN04487911_13423 [Arenibacter nanhaiticus]|uniref:Uncharacterized protein n=1 Tax=Arenibacter nanhaiticus TaxID=558155 RepID=A0A1M6LVT2_9FLAO|nr:hypothetical protein [Arenibacter nanhaiticus]SHJ75255.1 hypothetical protein SAMN04487911_13423 [Arenibacter nanhaiticus]